MDYNFSEIEKKWLDNWAKTNLYKVDEDTTREKYYVLDMFPYPSGSGLHVGHPLGFVASDIVSRYKRLNGFNVLHPMGFDAFGLPAEQYAIETGTHPRTTTLKNIDYFRSQLMRMGFSYDWSREVMTCDPKFYKWTQWIFMQLFNSWYDPFLNAAQPIETLINLFENEGSNKLFNLDKVEKNISSDDWKNFSEKEKQQYLMYFRLAYLDFAEVWWCEALGTVLANDEVKEGVSERGGHPVERMKLRQWFLRITEYADRLLNGLDTLDWSDAMKEMQRNWIGKSEGALVKFLIGGTSPLEGGKGGEIEIFTTRPDTIFGATFMVLAPEHELVEKITTAEYKTEVEKYLSYVKSRSERDRMTEVKKVTGQFTGAYAINPFTEKQIPIYIAEYVLAGYGTGAIMAVPSNDDRDHAFAEKFNIEIIPVVDQSKYPNAEREDKIGIMTNSGLLNGMEVKDAIKTILDEIEKRKIGKRKINYRLRDAGFSRQRYWGEPFPVYYVDDMPYLIPENELPVLLPEVNSYKPVGGAKAPLSALTEWTKYKNGTREVDTMPGYAGSSWYLYKYMDVNNENEFASKEKINYWKNVDLYIGGAEHAVGHLLYSRMWNHFLYDLDLVVEKEPFKKLVNQGMIQGVSKFTSIIQTNQVLLSIIGGGDFDHSKLPSIIISKNITEKIIAGDQIENEKLRSYLNQMLRDLYPDRNDLSIMEQIRFTSTRIPSSTVDGEKLDKEKFHRYENGRYSNYRIYPENDDFICWSESEKMSKSKINTTDPNEVIDEFGADCFRLYEMFLGPLDASKPWDTKGITGVSSFLRKVWRLFYENDILKITDEPATKAELKILHKTIKKVGEDIERMNFNTAVSSLMICVNELLEIKCNKKEILKDLLVLLAPLAPFITEELWSALGEEGSIHSAAWPQFNSEYLIENTFNYPIQVNGKLRDNVELPLDMPKEEVEKQVLALESIIKWTEGKTPKKVVVVPGKIVNVVV
jgi:leucyl-tRNA synthetase